MIKKNIAPFIPTQKQKQLSNESNINDVFERIYTTIILNIQTSLRKGSTQIINSVINDTINTSKLQSIKWY